MVFEFKRQRQAQNWTGKAATEASRKLGGHPDVEAARFAAEALGEFKIEGTIAARPGNMRREAGGARHEDLTDGVVSVDVEITPYEGLRSVIEIPVTIRRGRLERPVMFTHQGTPYILSQTALDDVLQYAKFDYPSYPERNNQFSLPGTRKESEFDPFDRYASASPTKKHAIENPQEAMMPDTTVYSEDEFQTELFGQDFPAGQEFEVSLSSRVPSSTGGEVVRDEPYWRATPVGGGDPIFLTEDEVLRLRTTSSPGEDNPAAHEMPGESLPPGAEVTSKRRPPPRKTPTPIGVGSPFWKPPTPESGQDVGGEDPTDIRSPSVSGSPTGQTQKPYYLEDTVVERSRKGKKIAAGSYQVGDVFEVVDAQAVDADFDVPVVKDGWTGTIDKAYPDGDFEVMWMSPDGQDDMQSLVTSEDLDLHITAGSLRLLNKQPKSNETVNPKNCPVCKVFPNHARKHQKTAQTVADALSWSATVFVHPNTLLGGSSGSMSMVRSTIDLVAKDTGWREDYPFEWSTDLASRSGSIAHTDTRAKLKIKTDGDKFKVTKLAGGGLQIQLEGTLSADSSDWEKFLLDDFLHGLAGSGGNVKLGPLRRVPLRYANKRAQTATDAFRFSLRVLWNPESRPSDDYDLERGSVSARSPTTWLRQEIGRSLEVMGLRDKGGMSYVDKGGAPEPMVRISDFGARPLPQGGYDVHIEGVMKPWRGDSKEDVENWLNDAFAYITRYHRDDAALGKTMLTLHPTHFRYANKRAHAQKAKK